MGGQQQKSAWVCVAVVATAHGVRGALRLRCFTERPEDAAGYGPVFDKSGRRLFDLRVIGQAKGGILAKATGIEDRNAAEALRGVELFVPRDVLPDLDDDEFYHSDLEGLAAVRENGELFGTVRRVVNHGAGDLIEIAGPDGAVMMLPFDRRTVPSIDIPGGRLVVDPPVELVAEEDRR